MPEEHRRGTARHEFLLRLADVLAPLTDAEQIQYEAARALGIHLGADRVGYAELDEDGVHSIVTRNYTNGVRGIEGRYRVSDFSPTLIAALRSGRTVARDDIANDPTLTPAERAAHASLEVGATVDLPMLKGDQLVAILFMHCRKAHHWTVDELTLLGDVAARTWDAVERARSEVALKASEARLRLALDIAELGTWSWDLATGAGDLDERGAEIVGLPPGYVADVAGAQFATIHPDDVAATQAAAEAGIAAGEPFTLEYRTLHPDGAVRYISSRASVVRDGAGRPVRLMGTNRDVTEQVLARREIEGLLAESERARAEADAARVEAESANRAKAEFLATMSHELRTPLNAIGGYAEILEMGIRGPVTPQQRDDLHRIQQSQRHLLGLINEVLNYAKLETGTVRFELQPVRVREALAGAEALIAPQARARGLRFVVAEAPAELSVHADPEKLRQILVNLMGNAVKFTESGGEVAVATGLEGDRVAFRVSDTGMGIPADKLGSIFDPFIQVHSDLTRTHEGTGLGLAISRDLARAMGGDVTVASEPGVGSVFSLVLPSIEQQRPRETAGETPKAGRGER